MRVLVVEDERDLADAVMRGLSRRGFAVDVARDGAEALEKSWASAYDVIVRRVQPECESRLSVRPGTHGCRRIVR